MNEYDITLILLIAFLLGTCAGRATAEPGIPIPLQRHAIAECTKDTNKPEYCECFAQDVADSFKRFGYSIEKPPTKLIGSIFQQTAYEQCQGLLVIQKASN